MLEQLKVLPSAYSEPFKVDNVETIHIYLNKNIWTKEVQVTSIIEFKNGNTKGEQQFKTQTIEEGIKQMQQFLNQLNNG